MKASFQLPRFHSLLPPCRRPRGERKEGERRGLEWKATTWVILGKGTLPLSSSFYSNAHTECSRSFPSSIHPTRSSSVKVQQHASQARIWRLLQKLLIPSGRKRSSNWKECSDFLPSTPEFDIELISLRIPAPQKEGIVTFLADPPVLEWGLIHSTWGKGTRARNEVRGAEFSLEIKSPEPVLFPENPYHFPMSKERKGRRKYVNEKSNSKLPNHEFPTLSKSLEKENSRLSIPIPPLHPAVLLFFK